MAFSETTSQSGHRARGRMLAYYGAPMLFSLGVHWLALRTWFSTDDFAWLALRMDVHSTRDLLHALFSPQAQGTVRTLSERLYFLVLSSIFGVEAPPFRIVAFATHFASLVLLMQIARRLTGSAMAGFLAAVLWTANAGLAEAMGWSSAYNEIAFAFCILLAFRLLLQYIDSEERKYWIWQWVVFVAGFGVLELNVVYPALAAGYALCCARAYLRKTLYLFIPSVIFAAVHFAFIPAPTDPYYKMHFDVSMFGTFWNYWTWALGALRAERIDWRPLWLALAVALAITLALAIFAARQLRLRKWLPLFLLAWFVIVIGPVLPLKNHFTEYYVTVPAIGIAILAAWAMAESRGYGIAIGAALAGLYFTVSMSDTYVADNYRYKPSRKVKYVMTALEELPKSEQSKTILLMGIDNETFWHSFPAAPFRLIGFYNVYIAPGSESAIERHPEWADTSRDMIPFDDAALALRAGNALVLALEGRRLVDLTVPYQKWAHKEFVARHPQFVDVADPDYADRVGPAWYPIEQHFRWMPKTATVKLDGPKKPGEVLEVKGYCPALVVASGPLEVSFQADGVPIGKATLKEPGQNFALQFPLPASVVGKAAIEVQVEVSRTVDAPPDPRHFGLVFGTFEVK